MKMPIMAQIKNESQSESVRVTNRSESRVLLKLGE